MSSADTESALVNSTPTATKDGERMGNIMVTKSRRTNHAAMFVARLHHLDSGHDLEIYAARWRTRRGLRARTKANADGTSLPINSRVGTMSRVGFVID